MSIQYGKCTVDVDEVNIFACDTDDEQDLRILNLLQFNVYDTAYILGSVLY